jgi:membrane protein
MSLTSFRYADLEEINFKDFFMRLYTKAFEEEDLLSNAAQVAYFFLFALFPLLLFLVSIFGIVLGSADDLRIEMFSYLQQAMPKSAFELVQTTIQEVTESSSGGKLTFGILIALYSASAGIDGIRVALNGIYNLTEDRAWWKTKLSSLAMTLGLGVLITIALGVIFYGSKFVTLILDSINLPIDSPVVLGILQWAIVLVVLTVVFALLYNFLPRHKKPKWVWITPGTIIGIVLWLLLSYSFRLGAVIILMLWLYLTALVILIGGAINAVLQEFTDPRAAKAGANKAAAKVLVEHPELNKEAREKAVADKKAETLATLSTTNTGNDVQTKTDKPKKISDDSDNSDDGAQPKVEKSKLKLIAGLLIGFVSNLRKK